MATTTMEEPEVVRKVHNPRRPMEAHRRPSKKYHREVYDRLSLQNSGFRGAGKVVMITGGATGIGFSIAEAFAKANVKQIVLLSRTNDRLIYAKESLSSINAAVEVTTYCASVTDHDRMTAILQDMLHIDVLVLSAVMVSDAVPMTDMTTDSVKDVFETNVISSYHLMKRYCELEMPVGRSKTLINVSSASSGLYFPLTSVYAASKAATVQLMQHCHLEQQTRPLNQRVRVFSFHPGMIYTPLVAQHVAPDWVDFEDARLPGQFAVWLSGPQSDFLQGRFVWAQWDVDELENKKGDFGDASYLTIGLIQ